VVGIEPEGSQCLAASLAAGRPVDVGVESVAADSLGARNCGPRGFEIAQRPVDHVVLVPDEAIVAAQRLLWRDYRMAIEPAGATALAVLMSGRYLPAYRDRPAALCGGANVALYKLPR